jgi:hypothetical protein
MNGATLDAATQVHRLNVCKNFLVNGLAFNLLHRNDSLLRRLLESNVGTVPYRETSDLVPILLKAEGDLVKSEMKKANAYSIAFDSTHEDEEMFAVMGRWINKDHNVSLR